MSPRVYVVIGKNFGDEGKGRVVDDLAGGRETADLGDNLMTATYRECDRCLVIRHNGGAQSGHTVVRKALQDSCGADREKRFVFHELGAGSFTGADTLWADTFYPDLYKLNEEYAAFYALSGIRSSIFSMPETPITTIDDVLLNMALEKSRGDGRHGSCGMGIYEAYLRTKAGFGITVGDVKKGGAHELYELLRRNREEYVIPRVRQLAAMHSANKAVAGTDNGAEIDISDSGIDMDRCSDIMELLEYDNVLMNAAEEMCNAAEKVTLVGDIPAFFEGYDRLIFETGQGLLLDSENTEYAPHVTGSRTGLTNPAAFVKRFGLRIDEVVYVTRSYVTRHGAGLLKHECSRQDLGIKTSDSTNVTNEWQGDFRYGPHGSIEEFLEAPLRDMEDAFIEPRRNNEIQIDAPMQPWHRPMVSLAVTHLSDTGNRMLFADAHSMDIKDFAKKSAIKGAFDGFYLYD